MTYYVVDAFTDKIFSGNPAGVCILDNELDEKLMQKIATENNLSETAFAVKSNKGYNLRWFTPECEIDLCGHATLAAAFILMNYVDKSLTEISFSTKSGILGVKKEGEFFTMNFPSRMPIECDIPLGLEKALGTKIIKAYRSRDLLVTLNDEMAVKELVPDFNALAQYKDYFGIVVTAKGDNCDFVSRYFAPASGVSEDPVTGSSHSSLIPFWSKYLNKDAMIARQLSNRGGQLQCKNLGDRVEIGGNAVLYSKGEILL